MKPYLKFAFVLLVGIAVGWSARTRSADVPQRISERSVSVDYSADISVYRGQVVPLARIRPYHVRTRGRTEHFGPPPVDPLDIWSISLDGGKTIISAAPVRP